jgi:hypothetical protein
VSSREKWIGKDTADSHDLFTVLFHHLSVEAEKYNVKI